MDITALIVAVIGAGAAIISAILLYRKTIVLMEYRLKNVEEKLDIHNGYAEKLNDMHDDIAQIKTDMAVISTEIKFLKEKQ